MIVGATAEYGECIMNIDRLIGKYIEACKEKDLDSDRIYVVISDHGNDDVYDHVDVAVTLKNRFGFKVSFS